MEKKFKMNKAQKKLFKQIRRNLRQGKPVRLIFRKRESDYMCHIMLEVMRHEHDKGKEMEGKTT